MSKYLVETFYTCTFKIVQKLDELNEKKLSELEKSNDGEMQIIDVKLDSRKTKTVNNKNKEISIEKSKNTTEIPSFISDKINNFEKTQAFKNNNISENFIPKKLYKEINSRSKMPDRRKGYIQKVSIGDHKIYLHTGESVSYTHLTLPTKA